MDFYKVNICENELQAQIQTLNAFFIAALSRNWLIFRTKVRIFFCLYKDWNLKLQAIAGQDRSEEYF